MIVPGLIVFGVFSYLPMIGLIIGFKQFSMSVGVLHSPWIGLANFGAAFFQRGLPSRGT